MNKPRYITENQPVDLGFVYELEKFESRNPFNTGISRGNTIIKRMHGKLEVDPSVENKIGYLLGVVRWYLLQQTRDEFAAGAGFIKSTIGKLEEPNLSKKQRPRRDTTARWIAYWREQGIPPAIVEQLLDLEQEKEGGDDINAFYYRLLHEHGDQIFDCLNCTNRGMWQRKKSGTVPPYLEGYKLLQKMYPDQTTEEARDLYRLRHSQHTKIWRSAQKNKLRELGYLDVYADLSILVEEYCAREYQQDVSLELLQKEFFLSEEDASAFYSGEPLSWEAVEWILEPIAREALGIPPEVEDEFCTDAQADSLEQLEIVLGHYEEQWKAVAALEVQKKQYAELYTKMRRAKDIRAVDIGRWADIEPPENRDTSYSYRNVDRQRTRYRMDDLLNSSLNFRCSTVAPAAVLIAAITEAHSEFQQLEDAYREVSGLHYKGVIRVQGYGQSVRIDREFIGATFADVAQKMWELWGEEFVDADVAETAQRVKDIEAGLVPESDVFAEERKEIEQAIAFIREEKVTAVHNRKAQEQEQEGQIPENCKSFTNLSAGIDAFHKVAGSYACLCDWMREENATMIINQVGLSSFCKLDMRDGVPNYVPQYMASWPQVHAVFKAVAEKKKWNLQKCIERAESMWYQAYPHYLMHLASDSVAMQSPLGRMLLTVIHSREKTQQQYAARWQQYEVPHSMLAKYIEFLRHETKMPPKGDLQQLFEAGDLDEEDVVIIIACGLAEGEDLHDLLAEHASEIFKIYDRESWCKYLPGLTQEELDAAATELGVLE